MSAIRGQRQPVSVRTSDSSDGVAGEKRGPASPPPPKTVKSATQRDKDGLGLDGSDRASLSNRFKTVRTSFKYLHDLTPKQIDAFMASYVIYNLDWTDGNQMIAELGPRYRERVGESLKAYYGVMNHLCALGDVEKMYIPPVMSKRATVLENQLLYERAISQAIQLRPGDRVLDLGCGRGRVAAHMGMSTGAQVTGINIDPVQVAQAREFNQERGLRNEFIVHDFNILPLPFADDTFDAFYQIQALSLCKDLGKLFCELHRVLKPGARISLLDWVSLPDYDASNPEHASLMRRVKPLIGAVGTPTPKSLENALQHAGFKVLRSENASQGGLQTPLIERVDVYFRAMRQIILGLVKLRCLPPHFRTLINRLCLDGEAFVKMDTMRLITTSYWVVAEKPA
ncbi:S-adenosyl-L-methionine-dependent methyltransferase [Podospora appendiculata]|uniref:S-adenosyl-L-methionine-dependent methyltransferase n=1 Tax=Podospora appendiculata TaxID=314037 RepID=A0AAE0XJ21_9PEZI|nr:S-adenosyl-L-methionine-dependent methyltransferase [Podospora appendiculata]